MSSTGTDPSGSRSGPLRA